MIWYFLAGFISGAVGMVLFAGWWIRKHAVRVEPEQMLESLKEMDCETYKKFMEGLIEIEKQQIEGHTSEGNMPGDSEER